jgi:hypothetical protein
MKERIQSFIAFALDDDRAALIAAVIIVAMWATILA